MPPCDYPSLSVDELLELYRQGDALAFREFYKRTHKFIFGFLRKKSTNHAETEEVFQETYFRVHRYISSFASRPDKSAISWLVTIAKNALIDRAKIQTRQAESNEDKVERAVGSWHTDDRSELIELLGQVCAGLSEADIALLGDRLIDEESFDEIALKHGITAANARQKFSRLLRRIRSVLTS